MDETPLYDSSNHPIPGHEPHQDSVKVIQQVVVEIHSLLETLNKQQSRAAQGGVPGDKDGIPEASGALRAVANSLDAFVQEQKSTNQEGKGFPKKSLAVQWWLFGATALAFVAAAVYAGIAHSQQRTMESQLYAMEGQWSSMISQWMTMRDTLIETQRSTNIAQEAINLSRNNFIREQRPYIWMGDANRDVATIPTLIGAQGNRQIGWNWFYTNYGKSPAYNVVIAMSMDVVGRQRFNMTPSSPTVLPPGRIDWSTVVSAHGIDDGEFQRLMQTDGGIIMRVIITYTDNVGRYETDLCFEHIRSGANAYCESGGNNIR